MFLVYLFISAREIKKIGGNLYLLGLLSSDDQLPCFQTLPNTASTLHPTFCFSVPIPGRQQPKEAAYNQLPALTDLEWFGQIFMTFQYYRFFIYLFQTESECKGHFARFSHFCTTKCTHLNFGEIAFGPPVYFAAILQTSSEAF